MWSGTDESSLRPHLGVQHAHAREVRIVDRIRRMSAIHPLRQQWLGNIRSDLLSGIVVALALIPGEIAFSIIAGVDPKVGLYASFCIAVITAIAAIAGGRPGMISAALRRLSGSVHRQESSVCPAAGQRGPAESARALPPAGRSLPRRLPGKPARTQRSPRRWPVRSCCLLR